MQSDTKSIASKRFKTFWKEFVNQWQLQLMAIPGVVYMIIFSFIPIYGLTIAFKKLHSY